MRNYIGIFNSPTHRNRTLVIRNGSATLINLERLLKDNDVHTPEDIWKLLEQTDGEPCPVSVLESNRWTSHGNDRIYYKMTYGLPDDWNIITSPCEKPVPTIKELVQSTGMKQTEFAKHFNNIPLRTVQDWYHGRRPCPEYIRGMMTTILNYEKEHKNG